MLSQPAHLQIFSAVRILADRDGSHTSVNNDTLARPCTSVRQSMDAMWRSAGSAQAYLVTAASAAAPRRAAASSTRASASRTEHSSTFQEARLALAAPWRTAATDKPCCCCARFGGFQGPDARFKLRRSGTHIVAHVSDSAGDGLACGSRNGRRVDTQLLQLTAQVIKPRMRLQNICRIADVFTHRGLDGS